MALCEWIYYVCHYNREHKNWTLYIVYWNKCFLEPSTLLPPTKEEFRNQTVHTNSIF